MIHDYVPLWQNMAEHMCIITSGLSCGDPPDVANATFTSDGSLFEDMAFYSCEPGFEVSEGVATWNVTCQDTYSWSLGSTCSSKKYYQGFLQTW